MPGVLLPDWRRPGASRFGIQLFGLQARARHGDRGCGQARCPLLWIRAARAWPAGPTTEASMGRKRGPDYRACGLALALDDRRHAGSAMSTVGGSVSE